MDLHSSLYPKPRSFLMSAIIEQHGGIIGVESEKGLGSTFWMRLPLRHRALSTEIKEGAAPAF
jgi:hypothetical protein